MKLIIWKLFCSYVFFSFECCMCMCISVCIIQKGELGNSKSCDKIQEVSRGDKYILRASLPPCPCADGHSGIQLWLCSGDGLYTTSHPCGLSYLVGLLVMGWKHTHIRYSPWSGPLPAKSSSYWQFLSIKLQGFWKQQGREMGLIQNQSMSRHWNPLAFFCWTVQCVFVISVIRQSICNNLCDAFCQFLLFLIVLQ